MLFAAGLPCLWVNYPAEMISYEIAGELLESALKSAKKRARELRNPWISCLISG